MPADEPSDAQKAELGYRAFRRYGGRASESDGLAIHAWKRLGFSSGRGDEGLVAVYDAQGAYIAISDSAGRSFRSSGSSVIVAASASFIAIAP